MEIHPPHAPIRSVGDFLYHMLAITLGITIALSLEIGIETWRHHNLAEHTRASFEAEFSHNRDKLIADRVHLTAVEHSLEELIGYMRNRVNHHPTTPPKLLTERRFAVLDSTAWDTAVATQGLLHVGFTQARAISGAYSLQNDFNTLQIRAEDEWFGLAAYDDPALVPDDEAEIALQKLSVNRAYLLSIENLETRVLDAYDHALKALRDGE